MFSSLPSAVLLLLASLLLFSSRVSAIPRVSLTTKAAGGPFAVTVDGDEWFTSGDVFFRTNGAVYSVADGSLNMTASQSGVLGADSVGQYRLHTATWTATGAATPFSVETSIKAYHVLTTQQNLPPGPPDTVRALLFTQRYLTAASGTNTSRQGVVSGWPSFALPSAARPELGYYQWAAQFMWTSRMAAVYNASAAIYGGVENGPFVVFDRSATTVAMVAAFDSFMDASMAVTQGSAGPQVSYGGLGNFLSIPAGFSMSTMLYFDDVGVTESVLRWGDILRAVYGKSRETSANDLVNSWLGYNTDRGATYYVYDIPGMTYEQTMYAVKAYAVEQGIPYKYWLTDSRWYQEGKDGGVDTWTPKPMHFPSGFANVTRALGWQLVAHNRYYSSNTSYAKQNGGTYDWLVQSNSSLPIDQRFWDDLFAQRSDWGLTMLFQDWLYTVSDGIAAVNERPGLGETWLKQMATAAERAGVSIQVSDASHASPHPPPVPSASLTSVCAAVRACDVRSTAWPLRATCSRR